MRKSNLLFAILLAPMLMMAQPVTFNLSNKAAFTLNGTDTLSFPYTGGMNAPQFNALDLDGDGVKDMLVFDRAGNKLMTFLFKNGKYTYAPLYESQFPPLYRWMIVRDYNCDGRPDIFTEVDYNAQPEPDKYVTSNGIRVLRNESTQPGKFIWKQDRNQLMDTGLGVLPATNLGVSNSDFNAIEDIDGDGDLDILLMPFGKNVITYYQNLSKEMGYNCDSLKFVFRDECWGYVSYLVNSNGFVLGDQSSCFRNYPGKKHNGTTLSLFDANDDGDLDLLYGDVGFPSLVYLENGKTINKLGRDSVIAQDTLFPKNSVQASIELFPASFYVDVDGDAKRDLLVAPNTEVAAKNKDMVMYYRNTGTAKVPVFTYQQSNFLVGQTVDLGGGSYPCLTDLDADGDLDLIVGTQGEFTRTNNSNDRLVLFLNKGTSNKARFELTDTNFLMLNNSTPKMLRMVPAFGDLNGDGKPDLLVGDLNGKLHFFENTGSGSSFAFTRKSDDYFNIYAGTSAAPQIADINQDGKMDILIGRKNGTVAYFENKGSATSPDFTSTASIDSIGKFSVAEMIMSGGNPFYFDGFATPHACDLDRDGRLEIIVGSETGRVFLFRNLEASATRKSDELEKIFSDAAGVNPSNLFFGNRTAVATGDLDGDSIPELIIGNTRGGLRMYAPQINGIISGLQNEVSSPAISLLVFPNPANDAITVSCSRNLLQGKYEVYDMTGRSLLTGPTSDYETVVYLSGISRGAYLIRISAPDGSVGVSRFLVN